MTEVHKLDIETMGFVADYMNAKLMARGSAIANSPESVGFHESLKSAVESARALGYAEACKDLSDMLNSILAQAEVMSGAKIN